MRAKKSASKKRTPAKASRKKASNKKPIRKKVSVAKKSNVSKKKVVAKKASKRKSTAGKKPAAKKISRKKVAKKKVAKKNVSSKKAASKKKVAKKKVAAKKPASKKKISKKSVSRKKAPVKAPAGKKTAKAKAKPAKRRSSGDVLSGPLHGIDPYVTRRSEEYMSAEQLSHFEAILQAWKKELMNEVDRTVHHMQDEAANFPDPNDRATQESEFGLELRTRDRERKLLRKINSALARIEDGTYGYCEETGEEIGLKRLEARPVATLCVEAQERRELAERQFRDRDDRYR